MPYEDTIPFMCWKRNGLSLKQKENKKILGNIVPFMCWKRNGLGNKTKIVGLPVTVHVRKLCSAIVRTSIYPVSSYRPKTVDTDDRTRHDTMQ